MGTASETVYCRGTGTNSLVSASGLQIGKSTVGNGFIQLQTDGVGSSGTVLLGYSNSSGANGVSIGQSTVASQNGVAIGSNSNCSTSNNSVCVGYSATANGGGGNCVAIGFASNASNSVGNGSAFGANAKATGQSSTAIGAGAQAQAVGSTAIGSGAQAQAVGSTAIGSGAIASIANSIVLGTASETVYCPGGLNVLSGTITMTHNGSSAGFTLNPDITYRQIGIGSVNLGGTSNICIGIASSTLGNNNIAHGYQSSTGASSSYSIAIGSGAVVNGSISNAVAIGYNANATLTNQIVLGTNSNTVYCLGTSSSLQLSGGVGLQTSYSVPPTSAMLGFQLSGSLASISFPSGNNVNLSTSGIRLTAGVWSINYSVELTVATSTITVTEQSLYCSLTSGGTFAQRLQPCGATHLQTSSSLYYNGDTPIFSGSFSYYVSSNTSASAIFNLPSFISVSLPITPFILLLA